MSRTFNVVYTSIPYEYTVLVTLVPKIDFIFYLLLSWKEFLVCIYCRE